MTICLLKRQQIHISITPFIYLHLLQQICDRIRDERILIKYSKIIKTPNVVQDFKEEKMFLVVIIGNDHEFEDSVREVSKNKFSLVF